MAKLSEPSLDPILNRDVTPEEAIAESQRNLALQNADPRWCLPLAYSFWIKGDFDQAYHSLHPFYSQLCDNVDYLMLFGMISRQLPGKVGEAEVSFKTVISIDPSRHDSYYNLGNLYFSQDKFDDAINNYLKSLSFCSTGSLVWLNLGVAARSNDNLQLSYKALCYSLQLDPSSIRAWCNYGITSHQLEKFDQAIAAYEYALGLDSDHGPSLVNLAMSLNASNRHPESLSYLQAASSLTLQEDSGDALFNLALTKLLLGDYVSGWELYECRFKTRNYYEYTRFPSGEWIQSTDCLLELASSNSPIVVWSEQGLGDAIQFSRYLPLLREMGLRPIFATRPLLVRLFQEWFNFEVEVVDDVDVDIRSFSHPHTALLSLPNLFSSSLTTLPSLNPYFQPPSPPPSPLHLLPLPGSLSVGLVWASNPDNKLMYRRKSVALKTLIEPLLPALREDLLQLHCLQVGDDAADLSPYFAHNNITDWNGRLHDFADTAHVVSQLDLVISVDTGVAHLAGALGVPTWLMLHYDGDFRWLRNTSSSPWYPSMRIFRQHQYGDWSSVAKDVVEELGRIYGLDLYSI